MKLKLIAAIAGLLCLSACATFDRYTTSDSYVAPRASVNVSSGEVGAGGAGGGGAGARR